MSKDLKFSKELAFPAEAVTQKFAVIGQSGGGKTYAALKLAELMLEIDAQIVWVDIPGSAEGLRSSADGKRAGFKVLLVGGQNGDLPLNANAGKLIADLVVDRGLSVILNVSEMVEEDQFQFLCDFFSRFFDRKRQNRSAVHVFIDEAQEVIPETPTSKLQARLRGIMVRMMKIGRNFGIGWTAITQEPQAASKRALNQAGTIIVVRTVGGHERKAIGLWAHSKRNTKEELELMEILPELKTGQALAWSPGWLRFAGVVHVLPRTTFDSSKTPEVGAARAAPKVKAALDVEQLRSDVKALIAEAEAVDPVALKRRIAELERQLAAKPSKAPVVKVGRVKPVPVVKPEFVERIEKASLAIAEAFGRWAVTANVDMERAFRPLLAALKKYPADAGALSRGGAGVQIPTVRPVPPPGVVPVRAPPPMPPAARAVPPPPPARAAAEGDAGELGPLRPGERKMLEAIASLHPKVISRPALSTLTGYGIRHGTFTTYLPNLKRRGLIVERADGVSLTGDGMAEAGDALKRGPREAPEVRAFWRAKLRPGEWKMLTILIDAERPLSRAELAEATGYGIRHGTFTTYLPTLKRLGLAVEEGGAISAARVLTEGDAAAA